MAILARRVVHECYWRHRGLTTYALIAWVLRAKAVSMTGFLVNASGFVRVDPWHSEPQIWLVQITRCHIDWYCQKAIVLHSLSGILPRHLSPGLILSKGNLLPCSILRRNPQTPSRLPGIGIGTPCHFVWWFKKSKQHCIVTNRWVPIQASLLSSIGFTCCPIKMHNRITCNACTRNYVIRFCGNLS